MENWVIACAGQTFKVLKRVRNDAREWCKLETLHSALDRQARLEAILKLGKLERHSSYIVNTNHIEGIQLHTVYTNGVVLIANVKEHKLITYYIAQPYQIRRYGIQDQALLALALEHKRQNMHQL